MDDYGRYCERCEDLGIEPLSEMDFLNSIEEELIKEMKKAIDKFVEEVV